MEERMHSCHLISDEKKSKWTVQEDNLSCIGFKRFTSKYMNMMSQKDIVAYLVS